MVSTNIYFMHSHLLKNYWLQRAFLLFLTLVSGSLTLAAQCTADGGSITLEDGSVATTICVDGIGDPLVVLRDGNAAADNTTFIITDATTGTILGIPPNNGPFDLDGAGPGVCTIWYLAYDDGLTGLTTGNNLTDLAGCFDLSNGIDVDRQENIAGEMTFADGSTTATICVDGIPDPLSVVRDGTATGANTTFLITDADSGEILGIPAGDGPFDLDGAGGGVCIIWYLAYSDGIEGLAVGSDIDDLEGCYVLSNCLFVNREENQAGEIALTDGSTSTSICVDGTPDPLEVVMSGASNGANTTFVITDTNTGEILGIPPGNGPFDLDGAGGGECTIWYLAYSDDLAGLTTGNNIADLDGCFDLSNGIVVTREANDGGAISLTDGSTTATICVDGIADPLTVVRDGNATGANRTFVITDATTGEILAIPPTDGPFDLDGAGGGVCDIWYLAYSDGLEGLATGNNISDLSGCFDLSNPIPVTREANDGGAIALADGSTAATICVDGIADPLTVVRDGNATGANRTFVITDATTGEILAIPPTDGPFDLDGAGGGVCDIWYLAYSDGLEGLATGNNLSDLSGCFDLSNPIPVTREANDGGAIALADGSTAATICVDGIADPLTVVRDGNATGANRTFVITDATTGEILAIPPTDGPFDLDGAGGGVCDIWYLAYSDGLEGLATGNNLSDLSGCFDLSNPIPVTREANDGGTIALEDGTTETSICVDGVADPLNVVRDGNATGANRTFVITDAATGEILAIPGNNGPFNLDGAGDGVCDIWYLAYSDGIEGLATGNNLSDLSGCFDLSNPISVNRQSPDGGMVSTADGSTTITATAGNVIVEVTHTTTATALSYWYIITDDNNAILGFANSADTNTLDLSAAPAGTCRIWGWSYRGEGDPMVGDDISTLTDGACEAISDNFITVIRQEPNCTASGGGITLEDGSTSTSICVDGVADPLTVIRDGNGMGANRTFVITDAATGEILAIPGDNGPFNLDGAGDGICDIWYLGYEDGLTGLMTGNTLADLDGCFGLSNPISVNRQSPDGGMVTTTDGATTVEATAGDVIVEVTHTTTATALSYWYIITDDNNAILGFANSADTNTLDLSAAPAGTCRIWGWSYRGEGDPVVGDDISTLTDGACEAISDNFITVIRSAPFTPGNLSISEVTASGEIEIFNGTDESIDLSTYWLCNFPAYQQLSALTVECGELNLLPGEYLVITGFDGFDAVDAELGLYSTNSFANPAAVVDYLEWGSTGHQRSSVAVAAGVWTAGDFEVAPTPDESLQTTTDADGNEVWSRGTPSPCEANDLTSSTSPRRSITTARVFPNPVGGNRLTVELAVETISDVEIAILDAQGRTVGGLLNTSLTGKGNVEINLPDMPAGVYFLRIVNGQRLLTARFQKF